jgi:beta-glucanase (GH16 family)
MVPLSAGGMPAREDSCMMSEFHACQIGGHFPNKIHIVVRKSKPVMFKTLFSSLRAAKTSASAKLGAFAAGLLLIAASAQAQFTANPVWSDEFDYTGSPDGSKWWFDQGGGGWGNNELQYYTNRTANAYVSGGRLVITARQENYGGSAYTSARMHSNSGNWTYGKVVVRARFSGVSGTWPAIWMLPNDWVYGGWPHSGEIDIMEHVGSNPGTVHGSVHTGAYNWPNGTQRTATTSVPDYGAYHNYRLEWTPDRIDIWVDERKYFTFFNENSGSETWPFNQRFHVLLNMAVGGWGGTPAGNFGSQTMEVDYVRVYGFTGTPTVPLNSNGYYRITARHSDRSLDVEEWSTADGGNIQQWTYGGGNNQRWRFEPVGNGYYRILSKHSGKAVDVANNSWSDGANVHQWTYVGGYNQQWEVLSVGSGYYKIVNRHSGKVLDVAGVSTANGANVQQWTYGGGENQQWSIVQVE